ncbi:TetR/AcrR family transcriptional regulator [Streptomyces gamaensis]|uniref:TetR/AcrR family transcriptional regulator n=1 Tax=Streptomyces gamaensis TaxID=1763542 RepID=A0ABW0YXN2_9ACTN
MPKRVDHEERRRRVAEALWRIASTRGLESASLRDVAAEAGMSLGQLQHYFTGKDELLVFALGHINELATQRVRERILALHTGPGEPPPRDVLRETAKVMLPLDDESRSGILVQVAYFARAVVDERMLAHAQEGLPLLLDFFSGQIRRAVERGEVAAHRDPRTEAMLLMALTDGLANHALMGGWSAEEALRLIDVHLERLFTV